MTTFERILLQAEAAKQAKLSAHDLEKGKEWYRASEIWENIGECDHRPTEFEAVALLQEQYYIIIRPVVVPTPVPIDEFNLDKYLAPVLTWGAHAIEAWGLKPVLN